MCVGRSREKFRHGRSGICSVVASELAAVNGRVTDGREGRLFWMQAAARLQRVEIDRHFMAPDLS